MMPGCAYQNLIPVDMCCSVGFIAWMGGRKDERYRTNFQGNLSLPTYLHELGVLDHREPSPQTGSDTQTEITGR